MAGFDPNQPRDEEGQWTEAGNAARTASGLSNADPAEIFTNARLILGSSSGFLAHINTLIDQKNPLSTAQIEEVINTAGKLSALQALKDYLENYLKYYDIDQEPQEIRNIGRMLKVFRNDWRWRW
mgnify:CR=1 FL=1